MVVGNMVTISLLGGRIGVPTVGLGHMADLPSPDTSSAGAQPWAAATEGAPGGVPGLGEIP